MKAKEWASISFEIAFQRCQKSNISALAKKQRKVIECAKIGFSSNCLKLVSTLYQYSVLKNDFLCQEK